MSDLLICTQCQISKHFKAILSLNMLSYSTFPIHYCKWIYVYMYFVYNICTHTLCIPQAAVAIPLLDCSTNFCCAFLIPNHKLEWKKLIFIHDLN